MTRRSKLETREPRWWAAIDAFSERHRLSVDATDQLVELVYDAINEDAATMLGASGGLKGGRARADRMTPKQRSDAARKAARARWNSALGEPGGGDKP
jgi:hypothetical protein